MEKLFVETKYRGDFTVPLEVIDKLPAKIVLTMPVQFLDFQEQIKQKLAAQGKEVLLFKSRHGKYPGQVLGCDILKFKEDYDAFFYIGDGKFHPTALLYNNEKPVYCYNPFNDQLEILEENYLEKVKKRRNGQLAKFLISTRIGLLVTTKPGQNQSLAVENLRSQLEKEGKEVFVFLAHEINFNSLENFNFIESWINTGCPRIVEDFKCLNLEDLDLLD